jgi:CHASE3 domain sensor protein
VNAVTAEKLARYFGVSVGYLLGTQEDPAELVNDDPELTEYLQQLSERSEMRMLFHVTKHATKEQIEAIVRMVESLQPPEP